MKKRTLFSTMILCLIFLLMLSLTATASAVTHTVSFDMGGHISGVPSQQVEDGKPFTPPFPWPFPKADDYDTTGLSLYGLFVEAPDASFSYNDLCHSSSSDGKRFDYDTPITRDITLYAGYEGVHYTSVYDLTNSREQYGGKAKAVTPCVPDNDYTSGNSGTTAVENTPVTLYAQPDDGYRFVGWSTSKSADDIISTKSKYSYIYKRQTHVYALFEAGTTDPITAISATLELPKAGTTAAKRPVVTVPDDANYSCDPGRCAWVVNPSTLETLSETASFEADKTYLAGIFLEPDPAYVFGSSVTARFNDSVTTINSIRIPDGIIFVVSFTPAAADPPPASDPSQQQQEDPPACQQQPPQENPPAGQQPPQENPPADQQPPQQDQPPQQEQPTDQPSAPQSDEKIVFSKLKSVKLKALSKKKIKVSWKKLSKKVRKEVKQIEIQVSTDPDFVNIVKSKILSSKKTSYTVPGLKKNTRYFIRIRAYNEKDGLKYVSEWVMKTKKTKKK